MNGDDEKQVKAVLSGDRKAFDVLVGRYQRQAVAVAARMLGNIDDAMEAAQEGFLRAYQALGQLKEPARFGPWLMKIMANQALNARRSRRRDPKLSLTRPLGPDKQDDAPLPLASKDPTVTEQLAAGELAEALQQAIDELPENLRTPLILFSVEKLPQKEIADIMNCSLQTVKWSVFEARRQLRKRLQKML
ncbi:MAG: hypothetical protein AMJ79_02725 [Phycisphaerae bacterium SM23_30]|nr:MAG: hypothetical protein AMJ79_02725 [Phycisphaerae bacterium SM23_30]